MDASTDLIAAARKPARRLSALEAERDALLAAKAGFERDASAGKYRD
jgi:hypothetical protein